LEIWALVWETKIVRRRWKVREWNADQNRFDNMSKNEGDEYGIG
jgi:hypothetical protein